MLIYDLLFILKSTIFYIFQRCSSTFVLFAYPNSYSCNADWFSCFFERHTTFGQSIIICYFDFFLSLGDFESYPMDKYS